MSGTASRRDDLTYLSGSRVAAGTPLLLEDVLVRHPNLGLFVENAGYSYLKALVTAGLGKRLMFGSDQMRWPGKIGRGIDAIESAPFLTEEQKRDILYRNAARLLRLEDSGPGASASR